MNDEELGLVYERDATGMAAAAGCLTGCAAATVFWLVLAAASWWWLR